VARFGHIGTLVNNAGIFIAKAFTHYTEVDYAAGVNLPASSTSPNSAS